MHMHELEQNQFLHVASREGLTQRGTEYVDDRGIRRRGCRPAWRRRLLGVDARECMARACCDSRRLSEIQRLTQMAVNHDFNADGR